MVAQFQKKLYTYSTGDFFVGDRSFTYKIFYTDGEGGFDILELQEWDEQAKELFVLNREEYREWIISEELARMEGGIWMS